MRLNRKRLTSFIGALILACSDFRYAQAEEESIMTGAEVSPSFIREVEDKQLIVSDQYRRWIETHTPTCCGAYDGGGVQELSVWLAEAKKIHTVFISVRYST